MKPHTYHSRRRKGTRSPSPNKIRRAGLFCFGGMGFSLGLREIT
jgi:hypothetical protein